MSGETAALEKEIQRLRQELKVTNDFFEANGWAMKATSKDVQEAADYVSEEYFQITGNDGGGHNEGYWHKPSQKELRIAVLILSLESRALKAEKQLAQLVEGTGAV